MFLLQRNYLRNPASCPTNRHFPLNLSLFGFGGGRKFVSFICLSFISLLRKHSKTYKLMSSPLKTAQDLGIQGDIRI